MKKVAALNEYKAVGIQSQLNEATPHQLVDMLLQGALDRIATAKGIMLRHEVAGKGELISRTIAIVDELRASLNHQQGGEISANLKALYDYIEKRLVEANVTSNPALLDEVVGLLGQVRSAWQSIAGAQQ